MKSSNIPSKERLIVQELKNFIEQDEYSAALVAGSRQVGKTTALLQLKEFYYPNAIYIDCSLNNVNTDYIEELLFKNDSSNLLLLDEINYIKEYEPYVQALYNLSSRLSFKMIITGSSPAHIISLWLNKLGGGRSKLFRLMPIKFIEYLYMTKRIKTYSEYSNITEKDFGNYLFLEGLNNNLKIVFDENYFHTFYNQVKIGNDMSCVKDSYYNYKLACL